MATLDGHRPPPSPRVLVGTPGHAEELDGFVDLTDEMRREGEEADDRPGPGSVPPWRQGYPNASKLVRRECERTDRLLQVELLELQAHVRDTGQKVAILFEGRDAADKGGAINRFMEHLNPRGARLVALSVPHRSWYNRAGVERVTGCSTPVHHLKFMRETPDFERMLDPLLVGPAARVHEDDEDPARFFPPIESLGR